MKKKTPALTMLKEGVSIANIAADLHASKQAIFDLKQATTGLPDNTMPTRKAGTGTKKRTTDGTNAVWPRDVILNPSINHANLKKEQTQAFTRHIHQCNSAPPQKDLNLPSCCAAKKPFLTAPMMKKRLQFCNDYLHSTSAYWKTVIISNENTFMLLRGGSKLVRRCCCCLPTPMALASGGSAMFPLVVHQPASPSIWPAVQSLQRGLSTNPGATMWCVCGCS